jgi:hypothetical protein
MNYTSKFMPEERTRIGYHPCLSSLNLLSPCVSVSSVTPC